jgi:hypothetical protein
MCSLIPSGFGQIVSPEFSMLGQLILRPHHNFITNQKSRRYDLAETKTEKEISHSIQSSQSKVHNILTAKQVNWYPILSSRLMKPSNEYLRTVSIAIHRIPRGTRVVTRIYDFLYANDTRSIFKIRSPKITPCFEYLRKAFRRHPPHPSGHESSGRDVRLSRSEPSKDLTLANVAESPTVRNPGGAYLEFLRVRKMKTSCIRMILDLFRTHSFFLQYLNLFIYFNILNPFTLNLFIYFNILNPFTFYLFIYFNILNPFTFYLFIYFNILNPFTFFKKILYHLHTRSIIPSAIPCGTSTWRSLRCRGK